MIFLELGNPETSRTGERRKSFVFYLITTLFPFNFFYSSLKREKSPEYTGFREKDEENYEFGDNAVYSTGQTWSLFIATVQSSYTNDA